MGCEWGKKGGKERERKRERRGRGSRGMGGQEKENENFLESFKAVCHSRN